MVNYFTYRSDFQGGGFVDPAIALQSSFAGLDFSYELDLFSNPTGDGRVLGRIEASGDGAEDKIDSVLEGLSRFSAHKKTLTGAQIFAASTHETGLSPEISGEYLLPFPNVESELYNLP